MFMAQVLAANIIIIQDNRPDITITVSEGASMIMVGCLPGMQHYVSIHRTLVQPLVSNAMLLVFSVYHLTLLSDKPSNGITIIPINIS